MRCTSIFLIVPALLAAQTGTVVRIVSSPPANGISSYYTGNRAPLLPNPLIKLPLGSVSPDGWLRHQMELMAHGFTGHLTEISEFCKFDGNAWISRDGRGEHGWEEVPYWLRGFGDLGVILSDERIRKEANRWVEGVLASQRPNGYFGSQANLENPDLKGSPDIWPQMVMLFPLRSMYEVTGDKRVLVFMSKYFRWQMTIPIEKFVNIGWQNWRAGDNLDSIYWLYNRTGERFLLDLARVNHERTSDWVGGIPTWHVVNIAECFREPGQYYQQTGDIRYLRATERVYDTVRGIYGQVPGGMYGADEAARPGFTGPRQCTETCGFVEMMYSDEVLTSITGDVKWADRAEEIAFNSLPAAMTPDLKALHYLTAPNQVQLDRENKAPMIADADTSSYSPYDYRCCQHNVAFGWPYFSEYQWMATRDNGLAAVFYAPGRVRAKVGDGTDIWITEATSYPFDDAINLTVSAPKAVRFPLTLRIPGWCQRPRISINGKALAPAAKPAKGWAVVDRTWKEGDQLRLELPASITVTEWTQNRDTVSVNRGPLTYSLRIRERWEKKGGTEEWPAWEVYPASPWNYGLLVDLQNPASSFEIVKKDAQLAAQPFAENDAPIVLKVKGRRIPQWRQEPNGMVGEVQPGPVRSDEPVEEVTLIPMGCARLRISAFPRIGQGPEARVWKEAVPIVLASQSGPYDPPTASNDGILPASSSDLTVPRFVWTERHGGTDWIEYMWSAPRRISATSVYWAATPRWGGVQLPASWKVQYWDGNQWQPVTGASPYEIRKDAFSRVRFDAVTTTGLRLAVELQESFTAGILEWQVE